MKKPLSISIINYFRKFDTLKNGIRSIPFFNQLFFEKDNLKITINELNLLREKYKKWVRMILNHKKSAIGIEDISHPSNFEINSKYRNPIKSRGRSYFNYFERFNKIKHGIRIIPFIGIIFREKDQLELEKKELLIDIKTYKKWAQYLLTKKEKNINHNITTIIQYSTIDYKFLKYCINEVKKFSNQIIITVADHFFDGSPENKGLLEKTYEENQEVEFVPIKYDPSLSLLFTRYWFAVSMIKGATKVNKDAEYVLLIDTDEIIEGTKFIEWLNNFNYKDYNAIKLAAYWYFRETKFRALNIEWAGLLIKKKFLIERLILHPWLRFGMYFRIPGEKISNALGIDDEPMVHHYSWVRNKQDMLKKVTTWGHKSDRNWIPLVNKEFETEFTENSTDFIYGFRYRIVKPFIEFNN